MDPLLFTQVVCQRSGATLSSSAVADSHAPAVAERHRGGRSGWLRAVVLGADDGIVSVASLAIGVVASGPAHTSVVTAAGAALVAGAMSMAAGEYVSVSSQSDIASADLARERVELAADPVGELSELSAIYVRRGVPADLARSVAKALTARDPLAAHARDELGLAEAGRARPIQAALSAAASFALGAAPDVRADRCAVDGSGRGAGRGVANGAHAPRYRWRQRRWRTSRARCVEGRSRRNPPPSR